MSLLDDARFTARVQKLVLVCLIQRFRFTIVPSSRFGRHQAVTVAPVSYTHLTLPTICSV